MGERAGFRSVSAIRVGDKVWAEGPSPAASIKHGWFYIVADLIKSDSMGYVRVQGDDNLYRPYLFTRERAHD